jgi:YegS/Rv2252/BmrU family lipid kinase
VHAAVVVNPRAGGRRADRFDRRAVETLVARVAACAGVTGSVLVTERPRHACDCARRALDEGADLVIAWGGDGTVNEVASVLVGTEVPLGLVPAGSGNGLARELRTPRKAAHALQVAFDRRTRAIDVGELGDRVFVNVAGLGFDAQVAWRFDERGARRGLRNYVRLTLAEIRRYVPNRYDVRWEGGSFAGAALIVAFANSRQYGNGACIAPGARLDDGQLDLVIVRATSPLRDLWRARRLFTRSLAQDPGVVAAGFGEAAVEGDPGQLAHVDGEPLEAPGGFVVRVRPAALRVAV